MQEILQTESLSMYASRKIREGFTLVELLVIVALMGLLATISEIFDFTGMP